MKTFISNRGVLLAVTLIGALAFRSGAQPNNVREENMTRILGSLRPVPGQAAAGPQQPREKTRLKFSPSGNLTHLGAPPGHAFQPGKGAPGQPEVIAQMFVKDNAALLGLSSSNADVAPLLTRKSATRTYVRLQQTYRGVPVFSGQLAVQLNAAEAVEFLSADISLEVNALDAQADWTTPAISGQQATGIVFAQAAALANGAVFNTTTPSLKIFAPSVVGDTGPARLVWELTVDSEQDPHLNEQWFVDAKTGEVVQRYPRTHTALNRQISDSANTTAYPGAIARVEGQAATGINNVDNAYLFLGQTYNFYNNNHGRDAWDDAGGTLFATVRYCPAVTNCPWSNAQWTGSRVRFGNNFTTDDVVGHEYTHAVTEFTSGLVYANQSGAINESFSDCWGEFVDLTNANGDDSAGVRWLVGEDLPNGAIRDMQDPPNGNDPDRFGSPLYVPPAGSPSSANDFGGVHSNSGVNNKLCYLLVDGDTFNGQTVYGKGIPAVADLYYECNANLLTAGSGWSDLAEALNQAAVNLGWSVDDRNNLYRACLAVEIASPDAIYVDWSINCAIKVGRQTCSAILGGPYMTVQTGITGADPGDTIYIRGGSYNEAVTFSEIGTIRAYTGNAVIGE